MRYLLLFIICFSCTKQFQKQTGQLKIIITYCKYSNAHPFVDKVTIYKHGNIFKEIDINYREEALIANLPFGKYTITYKSIYNILESTTITINNTKETLLNLCIDDINYNDNKNVLLLDELKTGESLAYFFESNGCFLSHKGKLILQKITDTKYKATINNLNFIVSDKQYQFIGEFEIELRCNHKDGCTTRDTYKIINRDNPTIFLITDASCQWRGFENLIEKLDLKERLFNQNVLQ